jgi:hypothetical protein
MELQSAAYFKNCSEGVIANVPPSLTASAAFAQQQQAQTQRVNGTIERVDGNTIYGKGSDGSAITLKLNDKVARTAAISPRGGLAHPT